MCRHEEKILRSGEGDGSSDDFNGIEIGEVGED